MVPEYLFSVRDALPGKMQAPSEAPGSNTAIVRILQGLGIYGVYHGTEDSATLLVDASQNGF